MRTASSLLDQAWRHRTRTRVGGEVLVVVLLAVFLASTSAKSYEVVDTGVLARNEVYWIDNARVLFPGYRNPLSPGDRSSSNSVLYVWNLGARALRVHAEIPDGDYICYANGYVSYAVRKDGKRYVREGMFGGETRREWVPPAPLSKIERNQFTCKDIDLSAADKVYPGFLFIPLRDGDGYFGWQRRQASAEAANSPLFFLPTGKGSNPIALSIQASQKRRITYSAYKGAYVIERSELARKDSDSAPGGRAWLLFPTGKTAEIQIPDGPWLRATWGYAPTRKGWVLSSRATGRRSDFDVGDAGIYLVNGNVAQRLIVGFPGAPAVSPDGCKVAATINPLTGPGLNATLRIIDFCK